jgi:large subunit ribosomal protein L29
MKINEIRNLDNKTLDEKLSELKNEMIKINAQIAIGATPKNPGQVKKIKKTIARVLGVKSSKIKSPIMKKSTQTNQKKPEAVGNKISRPPRKTSEVGKKHE